MSKLRILVALSLLLVLPAMGMAQKPSKNMAPVLNAISPDNATAGGTVFTMTVTGSNFTSGSAVQWNGSTLSTTVVSATQLDVSVASSLIASAGTAQVTVYTSGRWGGTSNALTFTINPAAAAPPPPPPPPPSPDPLAITTTSVPSATQGASYNANLGASGGTPAYTWGLVTSAGNLPPGLSLGSDGKITGSPSQAGTFPFTTQTSDTAGQAVQKQFSLTVAAPPTPTSTGYLFQSGFEGGNVADFTAVMNTTDVTVNGAASGVHSGSFSAQLRYFLCGDSTNTACGGAHSDYNRYIERDFNASNGYPNGLEHFFIRGYVMFHVNPGGTLMPQRKLIYMKDPTTSTANYSWCAVLGTATQATDGTGGALQFRISGDGGPANPGGVATWGFNNLAAYSFDTWYALEVEVQANTPGMRDGQLRVWVNGSNVLDQSGLSLRGTLTTGITRIEIGRQVDRFGYTNVDELRYWDDIVISTSYVGP